MGWVTALQRMWGKRKKRTPQICFEFTRKRSLPRRLRQTSDCTSSHQVTGGDFYRGTDESCPATISSFRLDKYEVTVGRFRKFAAAWNEGWRPSAGAGKHTHLNGGAGLESTTGGNEPGWDTAWASEVDTTDEARGTTDDNDTVSCTSAAGPDESLPTNNVNWFESATFRIWDGGFLASEVEWEYAAVGGDLERSYPWGEEEPDCSYANGSDVGGACALPNQSDNGLYQPVGSYSPKRDGRWHQNDLAGNVWERVLDWTPPPTPPRATTVRARQAQLSIPTASPEVDLGATTPTLLLPLPATATHRRIAEITLTSDAPGHRDQHKARHLSI